MSNEKPIARITGYNHGYCTIEPVHPAVVFPTGMALYARPAQAQEPTQPIVITAISNPEKFIHPSDVQPVSGAVSKPSSLGEQVRKAQAEVATWTPERRKNAQLEGSSSLSQRQ